MRRIRVHKIKLVSCNRTAYKSKKSLKHLLDFLVYNQTQWGFPISIFRIDPIFFKNGSTKRSLVKCNHILSDCKDCSLGKFVTRFPSIFFWGEELLAQYGKACVIFPGVSTRTLTHRKSSLLAFWVSASTVHRQSIDIWGCCLFNVVSICCAADICDK